MHSLFLVRVWAAAGFTLLVTVLATLLVACQSTETAEITDNDNSQTIVVYGASGKIGKLIVSEALRRGHKVVGVSRRPEKLSNDHANFTAQKGDVTDVESFKLTSRGADAIVISVVGNGADNAPETSVHARAASTAVAALSGMQDAPYLIQVGGATTMFGGKEAMLKNLPFPAKEGSKMYGMLFGHLVALQTYQASAIDWTVITPPTKLKGWTPIGVISSKRLGGYRTSTSDLVQDADGKNSIYVADLAAAAIDEVENRRFVRRRFTVGY